MRGRNHDTLGRVIREQKSGFCWQLYQTDMSLPSYVVPYTADEVAAALVSAYQPGCDIAVINVPLPFHSKPAWPLHCVASGSGEWTEKERFFFYYCVGNDCGRPVAHKVCPAYRMVLQFMVGCASSSRKTCLGWIPRLLCAECSPLVGDTSAFPVILEARAKVGRVLDRALESFNDSVKRKECYICTAKLSARAPRGTIPLCELVECAEALRIMGKTKVLKTIFEPSAHQRLINAVNHMKERKVDLNTSLRWSICHNVHGTCLNAGNMDLVCKTCRRVVYCSRRCMTVSSLIHQQHCTHYTQVWHMGALEIWQPKFIERLRSLTPRTDRGALQLAPMSSTVVVFCKCPSKGGDNERYLRAPRAYSERRGRHYYACVKGKELGCGFFRWEDSVADEYEEDSFCVPDGEGEESYRSE